MPRCFCCAALLPNLDDSEKFEVPNAISASDEPASPLAATDLPSQPTINPSQQLCGECLSTPPFFDETITVLCYREPFDRVISRYKFHGQVFYAVGWAHLLARTVVTTYVARHFSRLQLQNFADFPDLIVIAPLSRQRLQSRGYNQAHEIARHLPRLLKLQSERLPTNGLRVDGLLGHDTRRDTDALPILQLPPLTYQAQVIQKRRDTVKQSWLKKAERAKNVRRAFSVIPSVTSRSTLAGRHVAVVDDVMTSGATLNEIAKLLKKNGARRVSNWIVARTPRFDAAAK